MKNVTRVFSILLLAGVTCVPQTTEAVEAERGPIHKNQTLVDSQGIWLENMYLKVGITTNEYAGQVMELIYKPTAQSLSPREHTQGYCTDRMGEDRFFWKTKSADYTGKILSASEGEATAEVSYLWNYDYNDVQTQIRVTKIFRLVRGATTLEVTWRLQNVGKQTAQMTPWVKHLGGVREDLLAGPSLVPLESGPRDPGTEFIKPASPWTVRLSGTEESTKRPMVFSVLNYGDILQQFPWRDKLRFTLETILRRITLDPQESWETVYVLGVTPNLPSVTYVAPELVASAKIVPKAADSPAKAGEEVAFEVQIAAALDQGEKRLEGEILDAVQNVIETLPNRQVRLTPGEIHAVAYQFTPPKSGVYTISLSVYDEQKLKRLGERLEFQQSSITVPLVIGLSGTALETAQVLKPWNAESSGWPKRKPTQRKPYRVLAAKGPIRAAQIHTPGRLFPEETLDLNAAIQPAEMSAARGEFEALQIALEVDDPRDLEKLQLSFDGFKQGTQKIASDAKIYETVYLITDTPSGYKNFPIGAWPDPLFKQGWLDLVNQEAEFVQENKNVWQQSHRRVYWLLVNTPRDAQPGLYKGTVNVRLGSPDSGSPVLRVPVEFTVRAFELPSRPSFRCSTGLVGFGAAKFKTTLEALGVKPKQIEKLSAPSPTGETMIDQVWQTSLEYGWTPTMWSGVKMWEKHKDQGRGISVFAGHGREDEMRWLKEHNLLADAFVYAPFDEHADELVPQVATWCKEFREKSTMPILDCYYGANVKPLFGLVNVWLGQNPKQSWVAERKEAGDRFYQCNSSLVWHVEYEPVIGRATFWQDFADGADGRYVYSVARWTPEVFKKNWTSGNYMGCVIYPSPHGLTTSIRWETLRDGVEDYDYLTLLRAAVLQAEKVQEKPSEELVAAQQLLKANDLGAQVPTPLALHTLRNQMALLIESLERANAKH